MRRRFFGPSGHSGRRRRPSSMSTGRYSNFPSPSSCRRDHGNEISFPEPWNGTRRPRINQHRSTDVQCVRRDEGLNRSVCCSCLTRPKAAAKSPLSLWERATGNRSPSPFPPPIGRGNPIPSRKKYTKLVFSCRRILPYPAKTVQSASAWSAELTIPATAARSAATRWPAPTSPYRPGSGSGFARSSSFPTPRPRSGSDSPRH